MRSGTIKGWAFVHKWTSVVCTAFLLMLCITGLPLIFHEEIDEWQHGKPVLSAVAEGTPALSLDAILAKALAVQPGEVPLYLSFDDHLPIVYVTTGPAADAADSAMHFHSLDRRTGEILPAEVPGGFMDFMLQLHIDMFLGLPGMLFLGAMGFLFFIAIVSGVVLYVPFMARLPFGTLRHERRARVRWTDIHNLLGITTMMWAAVVGLTGVINTLVGPVTDYWKTDQLAEMTAPYAGQPLAETKVSVHTAVAEAMAAAPGMKPEFVAFPGVAWSSNHHLAVFLKGATPQTEKLLTPVLIDARTGELNAIRPMPWYMQGLLLSQPLHFGDYGGMPMKVLWALLDLFTIVVLGSGLYLWLAPKARRRGTSKPAAAA